MFQPYKTSGSFTHLIKELCDASFNPTASGKLTNFFVLNLFVKPGQTSPIQVTGNNNYC